MSFVLVFAARALGELEKLDKPTKEHILTRLDRAKEEPQLYFERLTGRMDYKLRAGDYRIIADLNISEKRIEVTKIGHRRNIYQHLP